MLLPPNRFRPTVGHAIAFIDGQNLFKSVKECFGYTFPNYDVLALAKAVCLSAGWTLKQTRFYTGVPTQKQDRSLNAFWAAKFATMGRQGVEVFWRHLKQREKTILLPGGAAHTYSIWQEKGIDVRLALDVVNMAYRQDYDVCIIFSQDQDLSEVVNDLKEISKAQARRIWIACAFPLASALGTTEDWNLPTGFKSASARMIPVSILEITAPRRSDRGHEKRGDRPLFYHGRSVRPAFLKDNPYWLKLDVFTARGVSL